MRFVCYALMPALIGSIYFFGWRSLAMVALSVTFSVLTEWLFMRSKNGKISEAAFVTGMLYGLILPPLLPFYMAALGALCSPSPLAVHYVPFRRYSLIIIQQFLNPLNIFLGHNPRLWFSLIIKIIGRCITNRIYRTQN